MRIYMYNSGEMKTHSYITRLSIAEISGSPHECGSGVPTNWHRNPGRKISSQSVPSWCHAMSDRLEAAPCNVNGPAAEVDCITSSCVSDVPATLARRALCACGRTVERQVRRPVQVRCVIIFPPHTCRKKRRSQDTDCGRPVLVISGSKANSHIVWSSIVLRHRWASSTRKSS